MRNQKTDISAIYPDLDSAQRAARALGTQGVDRSRIILVDGGEQFEKPAKVEYGKRHKKEFAQVSDDGLAKGASWREPAVCLHINCFTHNTAIRITRAGRGYSSRTCVPIWTSGYSVSTCWL